MKKLLLSLIGLGALIAIPASASAKVNVFACAPEWGALVEEIGGNKVNVYNASTAQQDVHFMRAKPSLLSAMRRADLVICSGASLEVGWLPILLQKAGGPDVQDGAVGSIMASNYVPMLEVMGSVDRSMGHVHPEGNPHVHLDPRNVVKVSKIVAERLGRIDSANAPSYTQRQESFSQNWQQAIAKWENQASNLKGQKVVVYHKSWSYLLNWLGVEAVASLEPKPGLPPTASHLDDVLKKIEGQNVLGIMITPFENEKPAKWLSEKANIPMLPLPFTVGGSKKATDLKSLFDETIMQLKNRS